MIFSRGKRTVRILSLVLVAIGVMACSPSLVRNPVPVSALTKDVPPQIPNIPNARYWGDTPPPNLAEIFAEAYRQRVASGLNRNAAAIAVSGGADDGAFGAGLMRAWSELGTRPEFVDVTGVSTGALSAPFIFLGRDYDDTLAKLYGGYSPEAYLSVRPLLSILPNVSVSDSAPLIKLINLYMDEEMMAKIAAEHRRGRRLLIQSSHLDAQRPVIWDLGAIAASGAPNALEVLRKALLASASVPVGYPPVLFEVEVDGKIYDELHVDGGVIAEDTTLAEWQYDIHKLLQRTGRGRYAPKVLYVVRNGRVTPEPKATEYNLLGIAGRSVSTLIKAQGLSDLVIAYESAKLMGADFRVTWIGQDFNAPYPAPFDPGYMKALQKYGYDLMMSGQAWDDRPLMLMSNAQRRASPRLVRSGS